MPQLFLTLVTLILFNVSFAGPIADYCTQLASDEVKTSDKSDFKKLFNEKVIQPLSKGNQSMKIYSQALDLNIVKLEKKLSSASHCDLINTLESDNEKVYTLEVEKKICTGYRIISTEDTVTEKNTLTYCYVRGIDDPHNTLISYCEDSFVKINLEYSSNHPMSSVNFEPEDLIDFSFQENGAYLSMAKKSGEEFKLKNDSYTTNPFKWELKNISSISTSSYHLHEHLCDFAN